LLTKKEVRVKARDYGLLNAERPDSQGICFLGKISYNDFIRHYLGEKEGLIVCKDNGRIIGKHSGHWFFTVGQRKGIISGDGPWFVISKEADTNTVFVSKNYRKNNFEIRDDIWIDEPSTNLLVRVRHGGELYHAKIDGKVITIDGDDAFAAGQFAVFYNDDLLIGSGVIT
jgi:tRNA-specific 2-thiouridylase